MSTPKTVQEREREYADAVGLLDGLGERFIELHAAGRDLSGWERAAEEARRRFRAAERALRKARSR